MQQHDHCLGLYNAEDGSLRSMGFWAVLQMLEDAQIVVDIEVRKCGYDFD